MLIRHSKTSNHFVLPTSLSTSLTMNWSVSSLHSKTKRVNALLETSLHHPLPLPCPLPTPLRLHALPASSVVDSTSRETAMKSAKHLKLQRNSCKSASLASRGRSRQRMQRMQTRLLLSLRRGRLLKFQFAGHASALASSTRSQWLKSRACTDWNTDTGASSHMTPHKHWFRSYSPHVVAIKLAEHSTIYSAGIGSVEFQPVIDGIPERPVVFHDVLHVPDLASKLLSLLHLARVKGYVINIESDCLRFSPSNQLHVTASVPPNNVGYLDGQVIVPKQAESAHFAITCPLDLTLWHRRCSHINFEDLKHMHSHNLVSGMVIRSASP